MKKFTWLAVPLMLLAACGTDEADTTGTGNSTEEVKVEFNTPAQAEPADSMVLSVSVTQGDETVEDAEEVVYEVWESGDRANSEMIPAEHKKEGVYEAETIFEEEGLYFVQAHTTARRMHTMPKTEITIGDPDPDSIVPDDSDDKEGMDKMDGHSGH